MSSSKKLEQRGGKRTVSRLRHKRAADVYWFLQHNISPHTDKYLLVYGLHLKLVVSFMLTGLDQNLASGDISFLPPYIILALESSGTPFLWDTLLQLLLSGLERHFSNGEWSMSVSAGRPQNTSCK